MRRVTARWFLAFPMALAGLVVAACQQTQAPIKIGTIYNLEGSQAILDTESSRGAALAFAGINAEGGVAGRQVRQFEAIGITEAREVHDATSELLARHPDMLTVVGLSDTDMARAAASAAAAFDRIFVTSGATSPKLPGEFPDHLFLACYGDNVQAAAAAQWLYQDMGARSIVVLYDDAYEFTRLLTGYFTDSWSHYTGIALQPIKVDPSDLSAAVPQMPDVDAVYLAMQTAESALPVIAKLRASGFDGPIVGADGYDAATIWAANPGISNVYYTTHAYFGPDSPNDISREFSMLYRQAYPDDAPTAFAGLGYDAIRLVSQVSADAETSRDVARALESVSGFKGVTGILSYGNGNVPRKSVTILRVSAGKTEFERELLPEFVPTP